MFWGYKSECVHQKNSGTLKILDELEKTWTRSQKDLKKYTLERMQIIPGEIKNLWTAS